MKNYVGTLLVMMCASSGVSAQEVLTLSNYQAIVNAQSPSFYYKFDGFSLTNTTSSSGLPALTINGIVGSQYDLFQNPSNCVYFTKLGDVVYGIGDGIISGGGPVGTNTSSAVGSITLLFRTVDPGPPSSSGNGPGAKVIFSAGGAAGTSNSLTLQFENPNTGSPSNALTLHFGDSVTTILPATNVAPDTWYYFALTYNESATNADGSPNTNKAAWYLGRLNGSGTLATGNTINNTNALAGDGSDFDIGSQTTGNSTFDKPGDGRVDEFATWTNRELSAAEIQAQFTNLPNVALPPVAAYQTVISNQMPAHYFQLAGNTVDSMDSLEVLAIHSSASTVPYLSSLGYGYDYFLDQNGAAYFAFASDAIYTNVNLLNGGGTPTGSPGTGTGSISGMFHALAYTNWPGEVYIFDAGGDTATSNAFALFFEGPTNANPYSLKMRFGDSSGVLIPGTNILSEWYYFAITYDETMTNHQTQWWVGRPGTPLQSGFFSSTNGSLAGAGNAFYIGNNVSDANALRYQNQSRTSNGQISQMAIWNRVLSTNEVTAQFNALTVQPPPPVLSIALRGTNAILSWPSSTSPSFVLQTNANLKTPNWISEGVTPAVVGTNNVVTNAIAPNALFYRLQN